MMIASSKMEGIQFDDAEDDDEEWENTESLHPYAINKGEETDTFDEDSWWAAQMLPWQLKKCNKNCDRSAKDALAPFRVKRNLASFSTDGELLFSESYIQKTVQVEEE